MKKTKNSSTQNQDSLVLRFLYHTVPGRMALKGLTCPNLSQLCGRYLDSPHSKWLISPFIRNHHIDLSEYEDEIYGCFNDCFCRRIKPEHRPVDGNPDHLISPCDGLLSVYPIQKGMVIPAKQSHYTIAKLLEDAETAKGFEDGLCLVFRLCVQHYHRYIFSDDGELLSYKEIPGILHTVRPIALAQVPVYTENARACTMIQSAHFGTMAQIEIGAMMVGRIVNHSNLGSVARGQEKGHFAYGGSTIILLLNKDQVALSDHIIAGTEQGLEVPVRAGECIGIRIKA